MQPYSTPSNPKIYHITHIDNLESILAFGGIASEAMLIKQKIDSTVVGLSSIKKRRLEQIEVNCHPGTKVGEYVPFYFCPRSIMLFLFYKRNYPELTYTGGQDPIIHLRSSFSSIVSWADNNSIRWAFSDINAGSYLVKFYNNSKDLDKINWRAVDARDFTDKFVKEGKQAEFLVYDFFPWHLVEEIGVINYNMSCRVRSILDLESDKPKPTISTKRDWYF